jgi:hypothetical protein
MRTFAAPRPVVTECICPPSVIVLLEWISQGAPEIR